LLKTKLPTRFDTKSMWRGVNSVALGDWSVTCRSIFAQRLFAAGKLVCSSFSALCIWSLIGLLQNPAMLMLESLPGWNDSQPNSTCRKSEAAG